MIKKLTLKEFEKLKEEKRKKYKEIGLIDFEEKRAEKMWDDPNSDVNEIPSWHYTWDKKLKCFVIFVDEDEFE
jgi:hypothetical protein